jgi:hypothetical protein
MLSITTIKGGPLSGLPTFLLHLEEGEDIARVGAIMASIEPFIPPITSFTIADQAGHVDAAKLLVLIQALRARGLMVLVNAVKHTEEWMENTTVTLFTDDQMTKEWAHVMVFISNVPPLLWRPSPAHVARPPLLYWFRKDATLDQVAKMPTGMRLWNAVDLSLEEEEEE